MTTASTSIDTYTADQQRIIDLPVDILLAVTAGAGTGKTHTMVGRIARLLSTDELQPHEILVLSFARSAVRELRSRLSGAGERGRLVSARTFDSWALELLMDVNAGVEWRERSFDSRIENAARLIRDGAADERLQDVGHLVIDEAQDVVGVRLELVKAIIDQTDCGFTVVGDAAQSIYGFQIRSAEERKHGADLLFGWLRSRFADDLTEAGLHENFRAHTAQARTALGFGPILRRSAETSSPARQAYEDLRTELLGRDDVGCLSDSFACLDVAGDGSGTTAILCRTNGEVLLASEHLTEAGVTHVVQRTAQDRVSPGWLAALFRHAPSTTVDRASFDDLVVLPAHHDPNLTWSLLRRRFSDRGGRIDLTRLRRAIAENRLPDELTAQPPADLVISTFHRAKGLEFDRVVVMDPGPLSSKPSDTPCEEEARLLYVAMTRPRKELMRTESLKGWKVFRDARVDRNVRGRLGRAYRFGMEAMGRDVDATNPPGVTGRESEVQNVLANVTVGAAVTLERRGPDGTTDGRSPNYQIVHDGVVIGEMSEAFREDLFRIRGGRHGYEPTSYPRGATGLRVDAVETVAGSEASGQIAGLGDRGVWLAPRLVGLSSFVLDPKETDA